MKMVIMTGPYFAGIGAKIYNKTLKNYVVYHNPDSMGFSASEITTLSIVTDKKVGDVIGSRIWLLTGKGSPRQFYICGYLIVDTVESGEDVGFQTRVSGTQGELFRPMLLLNDEEWFEEFKRSQGNFAFGFQQVKDNRFIYGLGAVVKRTSVTKGKVFPYCIYTIRHTEELRSVYLDGGAGEFTEGKVWRTGKALFEEAKAGGGKMPLFFAAADVNSPLLYSSQIDEMNLDEANSTTHVKYSNLQPLVEYIPKRSLRLMNNSGQLPDSYIRSYALCYTPDFLKAPRLALFAEYTREEVHDIFAPDSPFTPQTGTWGILGIVRIPNRAGDFVFFVTIGQQQGEHLFDEGITEDGVLTWQSQPKQAMVDQQIQEFINHDELKNTIYLFLRTRKGAKYTYLGKLKYLSHDSERENPVHFQWQIQDWNIPPAVIVHMGLRLLRSNKSTRQEQQTLEYVLKETPPPAPRARQGTTTAKFRGRKVADYSVRDAENKALGLRGEELVFLKEKEKLIAARRTDLADRVRHVSLVEGDGAGYDIESFTPEGQIKYIEVKTTKGPAETSFFMSSNEVEFSKQHSSNYYLYRVYNYDEATVSAMVYIVAGSIEEAFSMKPIQFRISRN